MLVVLIKYIFTMLVVLLLAVLIMVYLIYDNTTSAINTLSANSQSQLGTGTATGTEIDSPAEKIKFLDVEIEKNLFIHEFTVQFTLRTVNSDAMRTYLHTDAIDGIVYCFAGEEDKATIYLNDSDEVMFTVKTDGVNKLGHESGGEYNLTQLGIPQNELDYWTAVINNTDSSVNSCSKPCSKTEECQSWHSNAVCLNSVCKIPPYKNSAPLPSGCTCEKICMSGCCHGTRCGLAGDCDES